ncbi:MAG: hypothetical protein KDG89_13095 [Geminicoccaceae bacterium]|nr:hypothetical protein [Geminicoccaceae bacterium]
MSQSTFYDSLPQIRGATHRRGVPDRTATGMARELTGTTMRRGRGLSWNAFWHRRLPPLRATLVASLAVYVVALHLVALAAFTQTNMVDRVFLKLGIQPKPEFTLDFIPDMQRVVRLDRGAAPGSIVFLGDSHIRRLDLSHLPYPTVNLSVPGETSARLLARLPHYRSLRTARAIVLGVGVNDLMYRESQAYALNVEQIVRFLPPHTPLVVKSVMPVDEGSQGVFKNEDVAALNADLRRLCDARPRCIFVDVAPAVQDDTGALAAERHDGDGIHLKPEVEGLLTEWMAAGIDEALEEKR